MWLLYESTDGYIVFQTLEFFSELVGVKCICDLSRENVPNGIRSNGRTHGKRTDEKRVGKPFETDKANG